MLGILVMTPHVSAKNLHAAPYTADKSQRKYTSVAPAKFYGLGATGLVSVYNNSQKALLIDSNGKAMIWTPQGGAHPITTHFKDVQAISGDGKHIVAPVIEHTRGPGSGEGRYYGYYTVWGDGFGQYPIAPQNTISYQMGMTWQFSLSDNGQRVLVYDEGSKSTVYAFNSKARQYQPLRVKEGIVDYSSGTKNLIPHRIVALSPDGTVVMTDHGDRYQVTDHLTKLSNIEVSSSGIYNSDLINAIKNNKATFIVGNGARNISALVFDTPQQSVNNNGNIARQVMVRLLSWNLHDGYDYVSTLGDNSVADSLRMSEDGSTVAGLYKRGLGNQPFLWTEMRGLQSLVAIFQQVGLSNSTRNWHLQQVKWVSADGLAIAGEGVNPQGKKESWIAQLPKGWQTDVRPFSLQQVNLIRSKIKFLETIPPYAPLRLVKQLLPAGTSYTPPEWSQGSRSWGNRIFFSGVFAGGLTFYDDVDHNTRVAQPYHSSSALNYAIVDVEDFGHSKSRQTQFIHALREVLGTSSSETWYPIYNGWDDGSEGLWKVTWNLSGGRHISYDGDFHYMILTFPYSITGNSIPGDM